MSSPPPSAERLRKMAKAASDDYCETVEDLSGSKLTEIAALGSFLEHTIYTAAAEILSALPGPEERLRNAILTGWLANQNNDHMELDFIYAQAQTQARALLAEEAE